MQKLEEMTSGAIMTILETAEYGINGLIAGLEVAIADGGERTIMFKRSFDVNISGVKVNVCGISIGAKKDIELLGENGPCVDFGMMSISEKFDAIEWIFATLSTMSKERDK